MLCGPMPTCCSTSDQTPIGLNIFNMAILGTAVAYVLVAALLRVLPKNASGLSATALIASIIGVVAASQGFVFEYALGGTTDLSLAGIAGTMAGVHMLTCMAQPEGDHQLADSPLADYGIRGIDNEYLSTGLAGVLGVLITFGVGGGLFWLARRRGQKSDENLVASE
jgi:hypothetical protein